MSELSDRDSTVGYGDTAPTTQSACPFGMSVIAIGTASFALALGTVLGPAIEARLSRSLGRMTDSGFELLSNHILILGCGELTEANLEEFSLDIRDGTEILAIMPDDDTAQHLAERDFNVLTGDPTDEETLRKAHIEEARAVLVATNDDAEDALSVLTARYLNTEGYIVAAATNRENIGKLKRVGADAVISSQGMRAKSSFGRRWIGRVWTRLTSSGRSFPKCSTIGSRIRTRYHVIFIGDFTSCFNSSMRICSNTQNPNQKWKLLGHESLRSQFFSRNILRSPSILASVE